MEKKYIYLGKNLQIGSFFLKEKMVISEHDLEELKKENKKIGGLFISIDEFLKIESSIFHLKKIDKLFQEVSNGI